MKKLNKLGEDKSTSLIVTFIILIASFLIILFFIFILNPTETSEDLVCHDSVLARSTGVMQNLVTSAVPLNCKTDYICLSKDGTCEALTNSEIVKVKTKEEVYDALAEEGADCWWMFGEGKLNYLGNTQETELYCSICSQISFDDSLDNLFAINPSPVSRASAGIPETYSNFLIDREEFYKYLSNTNVSGKDMTYLDYFLGLQTSKLISEALKSNKSNFGYIDLEKQHFIMMGQFSKIGLLKDIWHAIKDGVFAVIALGVPVIGGPAAISIVVSNFYNPFNPRVNYMLGTVILGESGRAYLSPAIIEAYSEDYDKLQCADVTTLA